MGCDIHLRVEKQDREGNWVDGNLYNSEREVVEFYTGRNYRLFGILADVKDEHFLGPIAEPRGLPDDITDITKEYFVDDGGLHSVTYFTLQELTLVKHRYASVKHSGMISEHQKMLLEQYGETPDSWCKSSSNKDLVHAEWYDTYNPLEHFITSFEVFADTQWMKHHKDKIRVIIGFDN